MGSDRKTAALLYGIFFGLTVYVCYSLLSGGCVSILSTSLGIMGIAGDGVLDTSQLCSPLDQYLLHLRWGLAAGQLGGVGLYFGSLFLPSQTPTTKVIHLAILVYLVLGHGFVFFEAICFLLLSPIWAASVTWSALDLGLLLQLVSSQLGVALGIGLCFLGPEVLVGGPTATALAAAAASGPGPDLLSPRAHAGFRERTPVVLGGGDQRSESPEAVAAAAAGAGGSAKSAGPLLTQPDGSPALLRRRTNPINISEASPETRPRPASRQNRGHRAQTSRRATGTGTSATTTMARRTRSRQRRARAQASPGAADVPDEGFI